VVVARIEHSTLGWRASVLPPCHCHWPRVCVCVCVCVCVREGERENFISAEKKLFYFKTDLNQYLTGASPKLESWTLFVKCHLHVRFRSAFLHCGYRLTAREIAFDSSWIFERILRYEDKLEQYKKRTSKSQYETASANGSLDLTSHFISRLHQTITNVTFCRV